MNRIDRDLMPVSATLEIFELRWDQLHLTRLNLLLCQSIFFNFSASPVLPFLKIGATVEHWLRYFRLHRDQLRMSDLKRLPLQSWRLLQLDLWNGLALKTLLDLDPDFIAMDGKCEDFVFQLAHFFTQFSVLEDLRSWPVSLILQLVWQ